jgi:hypothetical protein
MDRIRAEWYLHIMQTWTDEDYKAHDDFYRIMLDGQTGKANKRKKN